MLQNLSLFLCNNIQYRYGTKAQNKGFASGFDTKVNQEADNTICTHPSTSCTVEGTQTPPPPPPLKDDDDDGEDRHDDSKKMDDKSDSW
jgi:hypothetical protein